MLIRFRRDMKASYLAISLAFLALSCTAPALASEPDYQTSRAQLEQVRQRIQQLQGEVRREQARRDRAGKQLRQADEAVAAAATKVHQLEQELAATHRRIDQLEQAVAEQQELLRGQRQQLARQLRAAYAGSSGGALKLLLHTEDPMRLGRMLTYHRYFQAARKQQMQTATEQLQALAQLEQGLLAEVAVLNELREQAVASQQQLQSARAQRAETLASIEARVVDRSSALERLQTDAAALERLLERLRGVLADVQGLQLEQQPFPSSRGRLAWPVDGALLAQFGQKRGIGEIRWNGVLIGGKEGAPVRAVARGHVVFADWLRGFGLLLIIDHGDGFMTLYGHNEAVFKEYGDWVQPGEIIAAIGSGGVPRKAGVYFEIRSGGKPVNPLHWLRPASSL